jgi:hypothetical protein
LSGIAGDGCAGYAAADYEQVESLFAEAGNPFVSRLSGR